MAPNRRNTQVQPAERPEAGRAFLPYIPQVTDRIGRLLERHRIKTIFKHTQREEHTTEEIHYPHRVFTASLVYIDTK